MTGASVVDGRLHGTIVAAGGADQPIVVMHEVARLVTAILELHAAEVVMVAPQAAPRLDDAAGRLSAVR